MPSCSFTHCIYRHERTNNDDLIIYIPHSFTNLKFDEYYLVMGDLESTHPASANEEKEEEAASLQMIDKKNALLTDALRHSLTTSEREGGGQRRRLVEHDAIEVRTSVKSTSL